MNRVVVTGLGVVSPVGNDVESFWHALCTGTCGIGPITRFDTTDFKVKIAGEVRNFDPKQYMDKLDILHSDIYTQFAMAAACQAMSDSRLASEIDPERIGVYIGTGIGGIATFMAEHQKLLERGPRRVSPFFIPMMIANMASSMIAMRFGCKGPAMPMVTACASGSNAIGEAMRLIRHGYADAMIAGGAEATVNALAAAGFSNMQALSASSDPYQASLPFDKRRTGFVMGEGAGVLLLEELEHAKTRGAKIYAEVVGYGATCDAHHITAPLADGSGGAKAMAMALTDGGVSPEQVGYINAHGTSTHLNDAGETAAVKTVFGPHAYQLAMSSTKSMTGHMLGAAGAVEAIFTALSLRDGFLPATIHYQTPDPDCDLDVVPNEGRPADIRYALSNSLGFGGHNGSLLLKKWED